MSVANICLLMVIRFDRDYNLMEENSMGCPSFYYKRALQCFARALVYMEDSKLAKELLEEKSEEKLETFILDKKKICNEKQFYYDAGRTVEYVLSEADEEGCDAFNACIGGLNMFDSFIGLGGEEGYEED